MTHRNTSSYLTRFLIAAFVAAACFAATEQSPDIHPSEHAAEEKASPNESELLQATEQSPNNAEVWLAYGGFLTEHGQWHKAIEPLHRAIALGNIDGMTFLSLGIAYQYAEDRRHALEYYTKALEQNCDSAFPTAGDAIF